jgi:hypothetical protein
MMLVFKGGDGEGVTEKREHLANLKERSEEAR